MKSRDITHPSHAAAELWEDLLGGLARGQQEQGLPGTGQGLAEAQLKGEAVAPQALTTTHW